MPSNPSLLTGRGLNVIRSLVVSLFLLILFIVGVWMLEQTMNSVVLLGRDYVDLPFYSLRVDVWFYHDVSYILLWLSYAGFVIWEITPWRKGRLTSGRVVIALSGFALLTAGLWLTQDVMNAVLILNRAYVDFPFFAWKPDLYNARDAARLLIILGFVGFYSLIRVSGED